MKKQTSQAVIDRMNTLCEAAMASPEGLRIETDSPREARKLRQQIYAARLELRKRNPSDASAVCLVDLKLEDTVLLILKPCAIINSFKITDIASGEAKKITPAAPSEEDILDLMIKMATKHGPGNYEAEAKDWFANGKTLESYQ